MKQKEKKKTPTPVQANIITENAFLAPRITSSSAGTKNKKTSHEADRTTFAVLESSSAKETAALEAPGAPPKTACEVWLTEFKAP